MFGFRCSGGSETTTVSGLIFSCAVKGRGSVLGVRCAGGSEVTSVSGFISACAVGGWVFGAVTTCESTGSSGPSLHSGCSSRGAWWEVSGEFWGFGGQGWGLEFWIRVRSQVLGILAIKQQRPPVRLCQGMMVTRIFCRKTVSIQKNLVIKFTARMLYHYPLRSCCVANFIARKFKLKLFSYEIECCAAQKATGDTFEPELSNFLRLVL